MKSCCSYNNTKKCLRKDGKVFSFPRRFTKKRCLSKANHGFSMKSSCAPFKFCKKKTMHLYKGGGKRKNITKKQFLYNPDDPKKSFDVYIDKDPSDTISIKYSDIEDIKNTIQKMERLYKNNKYSHKRIWQVGMIMKVRLESMHKRNIGKNIKNRYKLSKKYFNFLSKRTKEKNATQRKKMLFHL